MLHIQYQRVNCFFFVIHHKKLKSASESICHSYDSQKKYIHSGITVMILTSLHILKGLYTARRRLLIVIFSRKCIV